MKITELVIDSDLFEKNNNTNYLNFSESEEREYYYFLKILNAIIDSKCSLAYNDDIHMECLKIIKMCTPEIKQKFGYIMASEGCCKKVKYRLEIEDRDSFRGTSLEKKIPYLDVAYHLSDNRIIMSTETSVNNINENHIDKLLKIRVIYTNVHFIYDNI